VARCTDKHVQKLLRDPGITAQPWWDHAETVSNDLEQRHRWVDSWIVARLDAQHQVLPWPFCGIASFRRTPAVDTCAPGPAQEFGRLLVKPPARPT
jgi:hypothetical protein